MAIYSRNNDNIDEDPNGDLYDKHEDDILAYNDHTCSAEFLIKLVDDLESFWDEKIDSVNKKDDLLFSRRRKLKKLFTLWRDDKVAAISDLVDWHEEEAEELKNYLESAGCGGLL